MRSSILLSGLLAVPTAAQTVLHTNGPWITGSTTVSGVAAPGGGQWSELAAEMGVSRANKIYGFTAGSSEPGSPRVADDFTIAAGETWNIQQLRLLAFQSQTGITSTITGVTVRIWNGPPSGGGQIVFGDETTNRLAQTSFTGVYRAHNTVVPAACGGSVPGPPQTNRPIMHVYATVGQTFGPGTYWIDVNLTGSLASSISFVPTTMPWVREPNPAANAIRRTGIEWAPLDDNGLGCTPTVARQELFFEVIGTAGGAACYANCDGSTAPPVLNVADFSCFLTKFAGGHPYANCDGSTAAPVLNVADFSCFLTKFAAGCP